MNEEQGEYIEKIFQDFQGTLPETSSIENPKMEYHVLADGVFWSDEGIIKCHYDLSNAFRLVINYRTSLLISSKDIRFKEVFELAQKYFPNWIGFKKSRCEYNEEIANRIQRIRRVSKWKINKSFKDNE